MAEKKPPPVNVLKLIARATANLRKARKPKPRGHTNSTLSNRYVRWQDPNGDGR